MVTTALTVYGIETDTRQTLFQSLLLVATVLTVYGIETLQGFPRHKNALGSLQQYLPFTVLKLFMIISFCHEINNLLQQYLPFTVCDEGCEAAEA